MRTSKYGKETTFLWEGERKPEEIRLIPTQSTLQISDELQQKINLEWEKIVKKNPNVWDAPKWRTEFVYDDGKELNIFVSPTYYSQHNVMRHIQGQPMQFYPNPITINTVQVTDDSYILIGVKGKGSDQKGLGLVGAGFIERVKDKSGATIPPESIGYVVQRECLQETTYEKKKDFNMANARAIAVIFGSNHDTTVTFHLPLYATRKEVGINGDEHDDLILLPAKEDNILLFLNEGGYAGIKAADQLLGSLEAYLNTYIRIKK